MTDRTPQQIAERVRDAMLADDRASRMLGIEVLEVGPGRAVVAMTVRDDMLNGHDICHGGLITTLADSAFAFACNAYNELTVASGFSVDLLAPGHLGDRLTARCVELNKATRAGLYDVVVSNQHGRKVAQFRGRSHSMPGRPVVALD